jgi:hypothetical protein
MAPMSRTILTHFYVFDYDFAHVFSREKGIFNSKRDKKRIYAEWVLNRNLRAYLESSEKRILITCKPPIQATCPAELTERVGTIMDAEDCIGMNHQAPLRTDFERESQCILS